jgi:hypothetical protein
MDKNTKMLLGVGAVAVVAYLIYQNNKPKSFANASGRFAKTRTSSFPTCGQGSGPGSCSGVGGNLCGESCMNGVCNFWIYDEFGNPGPKWGTTTCGYNKKNATGKLKRRQQGSGYNNASTDAFGVLQGNSTATGYEMPYGR